MSLRDIAAWIGIYLLRVAMFALVCWGMYTFVAMLAITQENNERRYIERLHHL